MTGRRLSALVAFEGAALVALHAVGQVPVLAVPSVEAWPALLAADALVPVLLPALRVTALAAAYWLAVSTVLYLAGRTVALPGLVRAVGWATLPGVRRLVDGLVGASLFASVLTPPAAVAQEAGTAAVDAGGTLLPPVLPPELAGPGQVALPARAVVDGAPGTAADGAPGAAADGRAGAAADGRADAGAAPGQPGGPGSAARPVGVADGSGAPVGDVTRPVRAGDHLWGIAAEHLATVTGRSRAALTDREIHAYWVQVIAHNRARLRSGDPDLIFVGETVLLPRVELRG